MAHIAWKDQYRIGYKDIDAQHRVLLDLLRVTVGLLVQQVVVVQVDLGHRHVLAGLEVPQK